MELYSGHINKLIEELAGLPGIGHKSAQRLAFHLINMPQSRVERLAKTIVEAKENVRYCQECFTLTDKEICPVCANVNRDHSVIMVVENTRDLAAYEKNGKIYGRLSCAAWRDISHVGNRTGRYQIEGADEAAGR